MADPVLTPEEVQAAKIAASGLFGAMVLVFLRHPGNVVRVVLMLAMGVGFASIFAMPANIPVPLIGTVHLTAVQVGALWGLLGKIAADALVSAAEKRLDFSVIFGRKA